MPRVNSVLVVGVIHLTNFPVSATLFLFNYRG